MVPERWQTIKGVLAEALEIEPPMRSDFLTEACGGDDELRSEVESLLDVESNQIESLEVSAYISLYANNGQPKPGDRIDRYEIVREIAVGGMGSVFLAKRIDGAFDQNVALKLIKAGMDSESIIRRFFTERQILASLKHPNIAQLMDGGTTDKGQPFIVMEYVAGVTIKDFVDANSLDLNARLELFCRVCSAVSFAHQNLVIHRDIKPSNVLVTSQGDPKLLDFGIAKLLTSTAESDVTSTQSPAFTPDYASPEQILGEKLTTASDIYSLGILLYELLTGSRPYKTDSRNYSKIIKAVCQDEPSAPSRLRTISREMVETGEQIELSIPPSKLKGDLDNIVLKALRKEPHRRYASVEQFSDDIRHYLQGLPVSASADTWSYRTAKFVKRNRIAVVATFIVAASLIAGIVTTFYQARIARSERAKAEARFNDVRRLANSFVFEINDEIEKSPIKARGLVVERAIEYLDSLNRESSTDPTLKAELAAAYEKIGDVQGELFMPNLGNAGASLESQRKALEIREQLYKEKPSDVQRSIDLIKSLQKVGDILSVTGDIGAARLNYQKSVDLNVNISQAQPDNRDLQQQLAKAYLKLGQSILRSGSLTECLSTYEKSLAIVRQILEADHENADYLRLESIVQSYLAYVRILMGDSGQALADVRNSLEIEQRILKSDPKNRMLIDHLISAELWVGIGLREAGQPVESLRYMKEAFELQQKAYESDKQNFGELNALADTYSEMASTTVKLGDPSAAIKLFQAAIDRYTIVSANDRNDINTYRQIYLEKRFMADVQLQIGENAEAMKNFQNCVTVFLELTQKDPNNLEWKYDLAVCYSRIAKIQRTQKREAEAVENLSRATSILETLVAISPQNINYVKELNETRSLVAIK